MKYNTCYIIFLIILSIVKSEKNKIIYILHIEEENNEHIPLNDIDIAHCQAAGDFLSKENMYRIFFSSSLRSKETAHYFGKENFFGLIEFVEDTDIFPKKGNIDSILYQSLDFLSDFWDNDHESMIIVANEAISYALSLIFLNNSDEILVTKDISHCGVSKIHMKGLDSFSIEYWNENSFFKTREK